MSLGCVDHLFGLFGRNGKRLFAENMLSGRGRLQGIVYDFQQQGEMVKAIKDRAEIRNLRIGLESTREDLKAEEERLAAATPPAFVFLYGPRADVSSTELRGRQGGLI